MTVTGTAADVGGGVVTNVEVSLDGGATYHRATGTTSWSYTGVMTGVGATSIKVAGERRQRQPERRRRAATSRSAARARSSASWCRALPTHDDGSAVELGVRFRADSDGYVSGVRFFKGSGNTGTHTGTLWTVDGQALAAGTFTGESASGWQTLVFPEPVADHRRHDLHRVLLRSERALRGRRRLFPRRRPARAAADRPWRAERRRQRRLPDRPRLPDAVLRQHELLGRRPLQQGRHDTADRRAHLTGQQRDQRVASDPAVRDVRDDGRPGVGQVTVKDAGGQHRRRDDGIHPGDPHGGLHAVAPTSRYGARVHRLGHRDEHRGRADGRRRTPGPSPCRRPTRCPASARARSGRTRRRPPSPAPTTPAASSSASRWTADVDGQVTGVRFYKGPLNLGSHTGSLWTAAGGLLATVAFTGESGSGWQTAYFTAPVDVTAGHDLHRRPTARRPAATQ